MCRLGAIIGDLGAARPYLEAFRDFGRANRDGYGIGGFAGGVARIDRSPSSLLEAGEFSSTPWLADASAAVMHVRRATSGVTRLENTHPFHTGDEIVAHNGTFGELDGIERHLGPALDRMGVRGDTDSERLAALIAVETERAGGDEVEGYRRAVDYLADRHPMTSLTSVTVNGSGDLFALRYPENRTIFWKRLGTRDAVDGHRLLTPGDTSDAAPALTVLASRPLDASAGWNELRPGRLLHVRAGDLREEVVDVIDREPALRYTDTHRDDGMPWTGERRSRFIHADFGA